ncbi:tyrosine-type recombinase/integrase [Paraburkholderia bonniea]|uniref:tyrosine-type recombinase/integrase n=1 Tax=Paraburkholderia bonniea TaxID=2152891 RepID=UPI001290E31B|nr:tyrosine-type recombinase/integrase [Paraburkholderia bonniea]WJF91818.1 tyrosine-type recombinase/integrase [Paraburkholderia bonniea]WJF95137.1 tyrosine-type recombinase/integrase [Paraburkholderia bonniea]
MPLRASWPTRPSPADLFNQQREDWYLAPRLAFDAWLAQQAFRASSAEVYRAQWGLFLDWLAAQGQTLQTVDTRSIALFVAGLSIRKPQRARYLRLIERVLDHIRAIEFASTNPARFIAQDGAAAWREADNNDPTGFLSAAERTRLTTFLQAPLEASAPFQRWKARRDRALIAVFLGGGLKVGETRLLTVSCIEALPFLLIETANPAFTRRTHLLPFAVTALEVWLAERQRHAFSGDLLFPASLSGGPMHKATVLRAVDTLVEAADVISARQQRVSPQTLRNAFAASLFECNTDHDVIQQWLGLIQPVSIARLHLAWQAWCVQQEEPVSVGPVGAPWPPELAITSTDAPTTAPE